MDQRTAAKALGREGQAAQTPNGLSDHVAAVEAARSQLARDVDRLTTEVRAQMGQTMTKTVWKVGATAAAVIAGVAARKALTAVWQRTRHTDPPSNPTAPEVSWPEAVGWSMASGMAVGLARLLAARGSAAGWRRATGMLPPDMQKVTP
ncbi:MAG TPA: DUF4235 domain-containing protein [Egibacteraceae bacterium]|nr:DUF4235 domain-containing protein [Egibacteraceae bacterium]